MKLIFDMGLETEAGIEIDRVTERPLLNRLTASRSGAVGEIGVLDFFAEETFQTVSVEADNGALIPLAGEYTRFADLSVTYEDGGKTYHLSVSLEPAAAAEE